MKKVKQPGENISLKTKKNEDPAIMQWINAQTNLMDSLRYLIENEIAANGVRNLQAVIPTDRTGWQHGGAAWGGYAGTGGYAVTAEEPGAQAGAPAGSWSVTAEGTDGPAGTAAPDAQAGTPAGGPGEAMPPDDRAAAAPAGDPGGAIPPDGRAAAAPADSSAVETRAPGGQAAAKPPSVANNGANGRASSAAAHAGPAQEVAPEAESPAAVEDEIDDDDIESWL